LFFVHQYIDLFYYFRAMAPFCFLSISILIFLIIFSIFLSLSSSRGSLSFDISICYIPENHNIFLPAIYESMKRKHGYFY